LTPHLVGHRLRRGLRSLLGAGVVLGVALGLALASFASARDTASAYGRVLEAADAETAVVGHDLPPEQAAAILDAQPAIQRHHYQGGFLGFIAGIDAPVTGGVLASGQGGFALERPTLEAGRLPDPTRVDEVFINSEIADAAGFEVGDELTLRVLSLDDDTARDVPITVTGIGRFPREAVSDETALTGIVVPTTAFYRAHEDLRLYANSRLWLDDPAALPDLAQTLSEEGMYLSETRAQERRGVEEALRPTITVLVALGLLSSLAAAVLAVQVAQRRQDTWRTDDEILSALGSTRGGRSVVHLSAVGVEVVIAAVVALGAMLVASPLAPIGPLHEMDPGQGVHVDWTVAAVGAVALAVVLAGATLALIYRTPAPAREVDQPGRLTARAQRSSSLAGLSLAVRSRRRASVRLAVVVTLAATLLATVATVVVSGRTLVDEARRYGVSFDVLAFNAFGDQTSRGVERAFGGPEVEAVASYTNYPMLVEGRPVPGLGIHPIRGEVGPTVLDGEPLRHDDEVLLGVDTAQALDVELGDEVEVQSSNAFTGGPPPPPRVLRVVGLATFPAISQQGADEARLGVGALVTQPTFEALLGSDANGPEWTVAAMDEGADPIDLIAANPEGVEDAVGIPTRWFTDARPAELLQLDEASPVLAGGVVVALLLLMTVLAQGAWSRARASAGDLSILQALGCSRSQRARIAMWQAVPSGVAALVIGVPLGVAIGRLAFSAFARSIAVVDDPSSPAWLVVGLVLAVGAAVAVGALVAGQVARRVSGAVTLRGAVARRA
jgi:ABC-type lipoprotein release transport system permease subunit